MIKHYVHDGDALRKSVDSSCRDIPYKFDSSSEVVLKQARDKPAGDSERDLVDFLEWTLGKAPDTLTEREFGDLVESFDDLPQATLQAMQKAGADKGQISSFLKELFWEDFPRKALVLPKAIELLKNTPADAAALITVSDKPAPVVLPTIGPALPANRRDIKRWLSHQAHVLDPHVRRQFNRNIGAMVGFIMEEIAEPMRPSVLLDIRERLDNESRTFNNIREDRVVAVLRYKWRGGK